MRTRIRQSLAALVAATAAAFASAQAPANAPAYVDEPIASLAAGSQASERGNAIVQALNSEPALKGSKITLTQEGEDLVFLTGVTVTRDQMKRAMDIAGSQAGQGKVANAMTTEELVVASNAPPQANAPESASATPETGSTTPANSADAAAASEPILPATPEGGEKILPATPRT
jgi:hypothetical protein